MTLFVEIMKKYSAEWVSKYDVAVKGGMALMGFLFSQFKLQKIRWLSYIANLASLLVGALLVIQLPAYYFELQDAPNIQYFKWGPDLLIVVGACFFSFTNQFSMVSLIKVMQPDMPLHRYSVE